MPQTRFVLKKALELGHRVVVVVNKVDRPSARVEYVVNSTFELFCELNATDEQVRPWHTPCRRQEKQSRTLTSTSVGICPKGQNSGGKLVSHRWQVAGRHWQVGAGVETSGVALLVLPALALQAGPCASESWPHAYRLRCCMCPLTVRLPYSATPPASRGRPGWPLIWSPMCKPVLTPCLPFVLLLCSMLQCDFQTVYASGIQGKAGLAPDLEPHVQASPDPVLTVCAAAMFHVAVRLPDSATPPASRGRPGWPLRTWPMTWSPSSRQ